MTDKLLSTVEVARLTGLHVNNISLRCRAGTIPGAVQIGGRWLIPESAVKNIERYHADKRITQAAP